MIRHDINVNKTMSDQWEVSDAIRELISNALDESFLTETKRPSFKYSRNKMIIKDFGRGIKPDHFINNENNEKKNSNVIGMFGVGLKDAINVLYNKGVKIEINSINRKYTVSKDSKPNTESDTLFINEQILKKKIIGTEISLTGISDVDYTAAMSMFMVNSNVKVKWENNNGQILSGEQGKIFLRGVLIDENTSEYFYSYNILKPLNSLTKNFTRERKNINKSAYTDSIEAIYTKLAEDEFKEWFKPYAQDYYLNKNFEFKAKKAQDKYIKLGGKLISNELFNSLENEERNRYLDEGYILSDNDYSPELINEKIGVRPWNKLDESEKKIIESWLKIINEFNLPSCPFSRISIADKIISNSRIADGCYCPYGDDIILSKTIIKNDIDGLMVLIHECTHRESGYTDETREFQNALENNLKKVFKKIF